MAKLKNKKSVRKSVKIKPKSSKPATKVKQQQKNVKNSNEKADYSSMSVDDFLNQSFEDVSDDDKTEHQESDVSDNDNLKFEGNDGVLEEEEEDAAETTNNASSEDEIESHKESLAKLKKIDPEFYKFLEDNDKKLLNFDVSDDEEEDEKEPENEEDEDEVHTATGELEVASDESDFEVSICSL